MKELNFKTTKEIKVPKTILGQIIGQENAVKIVKKVIRQRRNVLLIGLPGIGKSMVGQALAELLPKEKLVDILSLPNPTDEHVPLIKTVPGGKGRQLITKAKLQNMSSFKNQNIIFFVLVILAMMAPWWIRRIYGDIMAAASLIGSMIFLAAFVIFLNLGKRMRMGGQETGIPKLLVDNTKTKKAPFIDASGAHSGALFGDVLHDPLQSLSDSNKIIKHNNKRTSISTEVNKLLKKHKNELIKKRNYVATYLDKNELKILAEKNNKIQKTPVLSVNKYKSDKHYIYKITTETGKIITITPEHKVAINNKGKKQYIEVSKLKRGEEVFVKE